MISFSLLCSTSLPECFSEEWHYSQSRIECSPSLARFSLEVVHSCACIQCHFRFHVHAYAHLCRHYFSLQRSFDSARRLQEKNLYTDMSLPFRQFLPQLHSILDPADGAEHMHDNKGNALPACIIMEKGEALNLWARGTGDGIDMVTGLQVCLCWLFRQLYVLHSAAFSTAAFSTDHRPTRNFMR